MNAPDLQFRKFTPRQRAKTYTIPEIIRIFDKTYGETWRTPKRLAQLVVIRYLYYKVCTKLKYSTIKTGAHIGKDHSTVVLGMQRLNRYLDTNDLLTMELLQKLPVEVRKLVK